MLRTILVDSLLSDVCVPSILPDSISYLTESSIRTRRPVDVTTSGMISMPKVVALPHLSDPQMAPPAFETKRRHSPVKEKQSIATGTKLTNTAPRQVNHHQSAETSLIPSKLERIDKFGNGKINRTSAENWLPDNFRTRSRMRELAMVQETLDGIIVREIDHARQLKRDSVPVYERAVNEESLAMVRKHPCGCCLQKYLYVNLPLKVSQKAIIDIRVKWTGESSSIFLFHWFQRVLPASKSALTQYSLGGNINILTRIYTKCRRDDVINNILRNQNHDCCGHLRCRHQHLHAFQHLYRRDEESEQDREEASITNVSKNAHLSQLHQCL